MQKACAVILTAALLLCICAGCGKHAANVAADTDKTAALTEDKNTTANDKSIGETGAVTSGEEAKAGKPAEENEAQPSAAGKNTVEEKAASAESTEKEEDAEQKASSDNPGSNVGESTVSQICTISISCDTILDNMEQCAANKRDFVPSDGVILPAVTVSFTQGETVFDVLKRVCQSRGIPVDFVDTALYGVYIRGIANLYEKDVGSTSGWTYCVNGTFPSFGCASYTLSDGDSVEWVYTCG